MELVVDLWMEGPTDMALERTLQLVWPQALAACVESFAEASFAVVARLLAVVEFLVCWPENTKT